MRDLKQRLYISTTADDANALARRYGLGVELAEYCTAVNLDEEHTAAHRRALAAIEGGSGALFFIRYA